jgi:hypothetical protein
MSAHGFGESNSGWHDVNLLVAWSAWATAGGAEWSLVRRVRAVKAWLHELFGARG